MNWRLSSNPPLVDVRPMLAPRAEVRPPTPRSIPGLTQRPFGRPVPYAVRREATRALDGLLVTWPLPLMSGRCSRPREWHRSGTRTQEWHRKGSRRVSLLSGSHASCSMGEAARGMEQWERVRWYFLEGCGLIEYQCQRCGVKSSTSTQATFYVSLVY